MVKHKIFKEFGSLGMAIYREALESFFTCNSHSFARLMNNKEFGKFIKNHYVAPRIKMELTKLIERINIKKDLSKTAQFLRCFTDEAYWDELVILDNNLKQAHADFYKEVNKFQRYGISLQ